jgi:hypothetical protein
MRRGVDGDAGDHAVGRPHGGDAGVAGRAMTRPGRAASLSFSTSYSFSSSRLTTTSFLASTLGRNIAVHDSETCGGGKRDQPCRYDSSFRWRYDVDCGGSPQLTDEKPKKKKLPDVDLTRKSVWFCLFVCLGRRPVSRWTLGTLLQVVQWANEGLTCKDIKHGTH